MTIKKPNIKRLKGSTGSTFSWDGKVMFHKTSGQITVQQVKVLIERITVGAKICRTYSLACPASFVLHRRLNESENHLQLPSWGFWWYKGVSEWLWNCPPHGRPHTPAIWAERGEGPHAWALLLQPPAAGPWALRSCHHLVLSGARAGICLARESRDFTAALHPSGVQRRDPLHRAICANLVRAQICRPWSGKTPMDWELTWVGLLVLGLQEH